MQSSTIEEVTLAGGCFWCIEKIYSDTKGVINVKPGYAGGSAENAKYEIVYTGNTKHAECVNIEFDTTIITLKDILEIFWHVHDPTTLDRQGNDVGHHYRSAIFYRDERQKELAEQTKKEVGESLWSDPIVTTLEPFEAFYEAEEKHLDYYNRVGAANPYCTVVISPKIAKFRKKFADKLK